MSSPLVEQARKRARDLWAVEGDSEDVKLLEALAAELEEARNLTVGKAIDHLERAERAEAELEEAQRQLQARLDAANRGWLDQASRHGAEVHQLELELTEARRALRDFFDEWDGELGAYAPSEETEAKMRAALGVLEPKEPA